MVGGARRGCPGVPSRLTIRAAPTAHVNLTTDPMPVIRASAALPLLFLAGTAVAANAQGCPPESAQFDFWIGEWRVSQEIRTADGRWLEFPARSVVSAAAGGCALVERWSGVVQFFWDGMQEPEPLEGLSVRAFDADAGIWKIWWLDSRHPDFGAPFSGRFRDGVGTFTRTTPAIGGSTLTTRIRFSEVTPAALRWDLSISRDGGVTWTPLWIMHFSRRGGE